MARIDLYAAHGLDATASCDELAQDLSAQLEAIDQYDTVNRGRVETARRILGDQQRRSVYNGMLADPAAHVDERVLAYIATGASSAPTLPPLGVPRHETPIPGQQYYGPVQSPSSPAPHNQQPAPYPDQQTALTQVVVVPAGIMPKAEFWADYWTVEVRDNGATLFLVATGKGSAARKRARKPGSDGSAITAGIIGGLVS